jgi:hypothetical protein
MTERPPISKRAGWPALTVALVAVVSFAIGRARGRAEGVAGTLLLGALADAEDPLRGFVAGQREAAAKGEQ